MRRAAKKKIEQADTTKRSAATQAVIHAVSYVLQLVVHRIIGAAVCGALRKKRLSRQTQQNAVQQLRMSYMQ
jgi:hypothetical protein